MAVTTTEFPDDDDGDGADHSDDPLYGETWTESIDSPLVEFKDTDPPPGSVLRLPPGGE